jgi:hypothetical protein
MNDVMERVQNDFINAGIDESILMDLKQASRVISSLNAPTST